MIILGIDPGTRRVGYGVVKKTGPRSEFLAAGLLDIKISRSQAAASRMPSRNPHANSDKGADEYSALLQIKKGVQGLIRRYKPEVLSIEKLFFGKNQKTGMEVSQARGVILLCAAEQGLRIFEYTPIQVKSAIGGYGMADKRGVAKMVRLFLNTPKLDIIDDATDALAIALTAAHNLALSRG